MAGDSDFEYTLTSSVEDYNRETPKFGRLPKSVTVQQADYDRLMESYRELERVKAELLANQRASTAAEEPSQRINWRLSTSKQIDPVDDKAQMLVQSLQEQVEINKSLSLQIREVQEKLSMLTQSWSEKLKNLQNHKLALLGQLEIVKQETQTPELISRDKVNKTKLLEAYKRLTCMQINQLEVGFYQIRISMNRNEITFTLRETENASYNYHLVSHSIDSERLSETLRNDIQFSQVLAPKFLMSVIKCLTT
mmetsp:Transcript_13651/g.25747  ORF Transcript_13651/g.25747 Transcript_13651/m.25747 type:complete len:252 (-) Transcript_13651:166-921(-)